MSLRPVNRGLRAQAIAHVNRLALALPVLLAGCDRDTASPASPSAPAFGSIQVNALTSGEDKDGDGYTVVVDNGVRYPLPPNGTITLTSVPVGSRRLELEGVASNCTAGNGVLRNVAVNAAQSVVVDFTITCVTRGEPEYPALLPVGMQLAFVRAGQIHLVNSDGTGVVRLSNGPSDCEPAWSPDGSRLAFVRGCDNESRDIYIMNADGSHLVRRTWLGHQSDPSWSPDGTQLSFAALTNGSLNIYRMNTIDDGNEATAVVARPGWDGDPAWSPDGSRIAYASDWIAYDFTSDIFIAALGGAGISQLTSGFAMSPNLVQYYQPAWSPDSKDLAVIECLQDWQTCATSTLAVMKVDGSAYRQLASTRGFARPSWAPDGRTIAFSYRGGISWIRSDATERGFIVTDGYDPAWRPSPNARIVR